MSSLHSDALGVLSSWRAPSREQEALRERYVEHVTTHADACEKACFPAHLTAGVLVMADDGGSVLLNLHRKARRWFAFGGHLEPGDTTLAGAALREGTEESGLLDLVVDPVPVHLSLHGVDFCSPDGPVRHLDVRFLAVVPAGTEPVVSDESIDLRWFPVDGLPTDEPDMVDLVQLSRERVHSQRSMPRSAAAETPSR